MNENSSLVFAFANDNARKWGGMTRAERFRSKCKAIESGCIIHSGGRDKDGYPMVPVRLSNGQETGRRASHVSLALIGVDVPNGRQVNHKCDNRLCVNPDHLFFGTQADNVQDMVSKGRHPHGDNAGRSKLTATAVKDIRANCKTRGDVKTFAQKYGVVQSTVSAALHRQNWKHI